MTPVRGQLDGLDGIMKCALMIGCMPCMRAQHGCWLCPCTLVCLGQLVCAIGRRRSGLKRTGEGVHLVTSFSFLIRSGGSYRVGKVVHLCAEYKSIRIAVSTELDKVMFQPHLIRLKA